MFYDFTSLKSGDFETVIFENNRGRAHFLVLLTPSALERYSEPGDWLRREIETALDSKRNIVPLMLEEFDFSSPAIAKYLIGKLAMLKKYSALNVPIEYFDEAMQRLCNKFLNVPLDAVVHPLSDVARDALHDQSSFAAMPVESRELEAQEFFERAANYGVIGDLDAAIQSSTDAILLQPDFAEAYYSRGIAWADKGDLDVVLKDFGEAVRLKPSLTIDRLESYANPGIRSEYIVGRAPQMVTVLLRPSGDSGRDIRRISRLHGTFISYPGRDHFAFQIYEEGLGHLIEFPHDTTGNCPELLSKVSMIVGVENIRIEPIE